MLASGRPFYITKGSALVSIMENSPNPAHRLVLERAFAEDTLFSLENGGVPKLVYDLVMAGEAVYLGYKFSDDLSISTEVVFSAKTGFMVNKERPWKRDFDLHLERLKSYGFFKKFLRDSVDSSGSNGAKGQTCGTTEGKPLQMRHFKSSFILYSIGMALAILAHCAERKSFSFI